MVLEIMAFVVSVPIPCPMPRFQCRGLQMAVYFWHADKNLSLVQVDTIILGVQPGIPEVNKIRSLHIFATSPEKNGEGGGG